jgi:hypothetical protein
VILALLTRILAEILEIVNIFLYQWIGFLIAYVTFFVIPMGLFGIYTIFFHRKSKKPKENNKQNILIVFSILGFKIPLYQVDFIIILIAGVCVLVYSFINGYSNAKNNETFYVINTIPEVVVLTSNGESHLCAQFDRDTNIVDTKFTVVDVRQDLGLYVKQEHLGRLRPAEIIVPVTEMEENLEEQEPPE